MTLLLLLNAHRISTIELFSVNNLILNNLSATFMLTEVLKHLSKDNPLDKFEYKVYNNNRLRVIACLKEYISRRDKYMNLPSDLLLTTLQKPFKGASTDTMRRWIKKVFVKNNIDFLLLVGSINQNQEHRV